MTRALLQTTVGKDEPNIVLLRYLIKPRYIVPYDSAFVFRCDDEFFLDEWRNGHHNTELRT